MRESFAHHFAFRPSEVELKFLRAPNWYVVAALVSATACAPPSPGPHVQGLLDEYAPELLIGATLSPNARALYRLEAAGDEGYRDSSFVGQGGLFDLLVHVDQPIEVLSRDAKVSARVTRVRLRVADTASLDRLRARFDSALGTPTPVCYVSTGTRFRYRFWPGMRARGIDLTEPLTSAPSGSTRPGVGSVTFGSSKFHPDSATVVPCTTG